MNNARSVSDSQPGSAEALRQMFTHLPGGDGDQLSRDMDGVTGMLAGLPGGGLDPSKMDPQQVHDAIWKILCFRDIVMKKIEVSSDRKIAEIKLTPASRTPSTGSLVLVLWSRRSPTPFPSSSSPH